MSSPALPSGTVTFLFTDIEGSTKLLQQLGEAYAQVRADHHRLLRQAFTAHRGTEVDTAGDSFFVAFPLAPEAVAAAVAATRALAEHPWPPTRPVCVPGAAGGLGDTNFASIADPMESDSVEQVSLGG
jgi:class 3 adenylate cyclase